MPVPIRSLVRLGPRPLRGVSRLIVMAGFAAVSAVGCSHAPPPVTPLTPGLEPWELPAAELGTQRLLRAHYDGPEGEGALRITFRLVSPRRYQALATLALGGRKLWSLEVDGDEGLWIDHRAETWCRLEGRLEVAGGLLTALPFPAFPALLLGRLPEAPAAALKEKGGTVSFRGGGTRRWRAETEQGRVVSWTLWEGARPVAWWERQGAEAILSDRRHQVQLRWREVVREPLAGELEPLTVPAGYRPGSCEGVDFRVDPSSADM